MVEGQKVCEESTEETRGVLKCELLLVGHFTQTQEKQHVFIIALLESQTCTAALNYNNRTMAGVNQEDQPIDNKPTV